MEDLDEVVARLRPVDRQMVGDILAATAKHFGVTVSDIRGHGRVDHQVAARHAVMWLLRERLGLGYKMIGRVVGKDHSTVMHACERLRAGHGSRRVTDFTAALELATPYPSAPPDLDDNMLAMAKAELADRLRHDLGYHAPTTPEVISAHERVRQVILNTGLELLELCPDGRELRQALSSLETAMHWSNAAIAKYQRVGA